MEVCFWIRKIYKGKGDNSMKGQGIRVLPFALVFLIGLGMFGFGVYGYFHLRILGYQPVPFQISSISFGKNPTRISWSIDNVPRFAENIVFQATFVGFLIYENKTIPDNTPVVIRFEENGVLIEDWTVPEVHYSYPFWGDTWITFNQVKTLILPVENASIRLSLVSPSVELDRGCVTLHELSVSIAYLDKVEVRGFLRDRTGKTVENVTIGAWVDNSLVAFGYFSAEYCLALPPMENIRIVAWAKGYKVVEEAIQTGTEDMWVNLVFSMELPVSKEALLSISGLLLMGSGAVGLVWTRRTI